MSGNIVFYLIILLSYLALFSILFIFVKKVISKNGFNILSVFILTFALFYFLTPFIQLLFQNFRDNESLFTRLLNQLTDEAVFLNFLLTFLCLILIIITYGISFSKKNTKVFDTEVVHSLNLKTYPFLLLITHGIFIICVFSILLLINETGSFRSYLALGSSTRGLDNNPTLLISSSHLQLVTLSTLVLVTPYLYYFLYKIKKNKWVLISFILAFIFSIIFLLYNQGRAPIVLFFLPFLFIINSKKRNKSGFLKLSVLFVIAIGILNYLDILFNYISYGVVNQSENENFITLFLREFSYPFSNFALRSELIGYSGFRYFYDYVIWPLTMIPDSILGFLGFSKSEITSVSSFNTEAYGYLLGADPSGGIPVDFLSLHYYQWGYISLIIGCIITGVILKKLDQIYSFFGNNIAIKIILYRISFSMINIINNAEPSAVVRNRLDIVFLLFIIIYIYKRQKNIIRNKEI